MHFSKSSLHIFLEPEKVMWHYFYDSVKHFNKLKN